MGVTDTLPSKVINNAAVAERLTGTRGEIVMTAKFFVPHYKLQCFVLACTGIPRSGRTTFQLPFATSTLRTCCSIKLCNLGTSLRMARLPTSEVVWSLSVKSDGNVIDKIGPMGEGEGPERITCIASRANVLRISWMRLTGDSNLASEIVSETGRRAKDVIG